jgi:hypothetical protein
MSGHENTILPNEQISTARGIAPTDPRDGQLWYSDVDNILRIYDVSRGDWKDISGPSDEDFFLDDGLTSHYKMDEGAAETMTDELAAHTLDRFGPFVAASTTGVLNLARTFVGNAAQYYANATDIASVGVYSIAAHVRFDGVGDNSLFIAGYTAGGVDKVFELRNEKIEFYDAGGFVVESGVFTSDILTSGVFKTVGVSVTYGGRYNVYVNGFQFFSGVAPSKVVGMPFGQIRIGQGLAFTIDSLSIYNDRSHDEYHAVTYDNAGDGIDYSNYPITNIRRAPVSILAKGIDENSDRINLIENTDILIDTAVPNFQDALDAANAPDASNPFATLAEIGIGRTLLMGRVAGAGTPLLDVGIAGASFSVGKTVTGVYEITLIGMPAVDVIILAQHNHKNGARTQFAPSITDKSADTGFGTNTGFRARLEQVVHLSCGGCPYMDNGAVDGDWSFVVKEMI